MNLFQQILSVSKEFREHFEKENQQEERLKAVEKKVSGGGSAGGSAYQPYKKQSLLLEFRPSRGEIVTLNSIGDMITKKQSGGNYGKYYVDEQFFNDGDILKTTITIAPIDGYVVCVPDFNMVTGRTPQAISQHTIQNKNETYFGQVTLSKYGYQGEIFADNNTFFGLSYFKSGVQVDNEQKRSFNIVIDVEIHKAN